MKAPSKFPACSLRAWLILFSLSLACAFSGCSTVRPVTQEKEPIQPITQEEQQTAWEDMSLGQKVVYCLWWPFENFRVDNDWAEKAP